MQFIMHYDMVQIVLQWTENAETHWVYHVLFWMAHLVHYLNGLHINQVGWEGQECSLIFPGKNGENKVKWLSKDDFKMFTHMWTRENDFELCSIIFFPTWP